MVEIRKRVGLVFQYPEYQLFEETVALDVAFGPKNLGLTKKEAELRAYEALKKVGLPDDLFYQSVKRWNWSASTMKKSRRALRLNFLGARSGGWPWPESSPCGRKC